MDYKQTVYLSEPEDVPEELYGRFECLPGRIAVAPYAAESRGGVLMPGSGRLGADMGRVVASGTWLEPGDEVIFSPYDGTWFKGVRMYGVAAPWNESILAVRRGSMLMPTGDWVLVARAKKQYKIEVFHRFDCGEYDSMGEVQSVGEGVWVEHPDTGEQWLRPVAVKPGNLIVFNQERGFNVRFGPDDSWFFVREPDILAIGDAYGLA